MAKVKKHDVFILGEHYQIDISVSAKTGKFSAALPLQFRGIAEYSWESTTMAELIIAINNAVDAVNNVVTTTEIIIAYKLTTYTPFVKNCDVLIGVGWKPLLKETVGKQVTYYLVKKIPDHMRGNWIEFREEVAPGFFKMGRYYTSISQGVDPEKDSVIPFSEATYNFFESTVQALLKVSNKMTEFLNPETLPAAIESGQKLLS